MPWKASQNSSTMRMQPTPLMTGMMKTKVRRSAQKIAAMTAAPGLMGLLNGCAYAYLNKPMDQPQIYAKSCNAVDLCWIRFRGNGDYAAPSMYSTSSPATGRCCATSKTLISPTTSPTPYAMSTLPVQNATRQKRATATGSPLVSTRKALRHEPFKKHSQADACSSTRRTALASFRLNSLIPSSALKAVSSATQNMRIAKKLI